MKFIRYQPNSLFNPASNFTGLREEMDRLFDVAFPALSTLQREGLFGNRSGDFPVDLYQEKDSYVVRAELPGFRKEDLSVEVADGVLTVSGHQKTTTPSEQKEKVAGNTAATERRVTRSVTLPEHVSADKIEARYENGVLTVTLPKREDVKPRQIGINVK